MTSFPKVFIVILNYNGKDFIKKCLSSVFKIDYPNFEVVFVDNNSTDGSLEMAKQTFSKASFIKNEKNIGFSAGNNIGIRFALERMADYVLLLNNDTEVTRDFLAKLVETAGKEASFGVLSPVVKGNDGNIWFAGGKIKWFSMKSRHDLDIKKDGCYETGFISGCSMFVKAEVFKKAGLFDEDFFLYWEDADFSLRAKKAGFKTMIVPNSRIYHLERSEENKENKVYWLVLSGLIFFKKRAPFLLKSWLFLYLKGRKIKNSIDVRFGKNKLANIVQKAYVDFGKAKF